MAKVFSIINNKGGTGKTTTCLNLGAAFSKHGFRVLLIDLDSQCNLSSSAGLINMDRHIGNLLLSQHNFDSVVADCDMYSVIPSSDKLLDFEVQINNEPGREYLLKESLEEVKKMFDYILIDCPPSLGILSLNSLVASDYYLVPMQTENYAFIGLDKILQVTDKVKKRMNSVLDLAGILLVKMSMKTKFSQAVVSSINNNEQLKNKLFETTIRQDIALMETSAFGKNIFEYAPHSRGAIDYYSLSTEIIEKYGK